MPVMSRRHQVGRELDAAEAQVQRVGQRADHQRLGQARHADEQAVAAGEDGDEQLLEHALLADDDLAQLLADAAVAVVEPLDGGDVALDPRPAWGRPRFGFESGRVIARQPRPQPQRRRPPGGTCTTRPQF